MIINNLITLSVLVGWFVSLVSCDVHTLWKQVDHVSPSVQESAVSDMIKRIAGSYFKPQINVGGIERLGDGLDQVVLDYSKDGLLSINATTGVAAAWGFNHFLKYRCNSHISWETRNVNPAACQPTVNLTLKGNDKYRYYMNVCTPGYSFAWWEWKDWETHLDWMALNGINLALAFTGQEEIWRRVWTKLGLSQEDLDEYFVGPAFLPWGRMGNIRGWGGPLTQSWHQKQLKIQHQILDRMRSFGMIPVLPAFSGKVPHGYAKLHPESNFTSAGWNYFPANLTDVLLLDPIDPLFDDVGKLFIEEYTKEFGTNHVYNCDSFNEMRPPTNSTDFLAKVGKSVYAGMSQADPDAVWMMQGWLFLDQDFWGFDQIKALLNSVKTGSMLLLDLDSTEFPQYTRSDSYMGQPFIFNMLHNFGGIQQLFGRDDIVNTRSFQARNMDNSSLVGIGLTPEGIHSSYVMSDLMLEMAWRKEPVPDMETWFQQYATRRYGKENTNATKAWALLSRNVYNSSVSNPHQNVLLINPPQLSMNDDTWYSLAELYEAWGLLLNASSDFSGTETYEYDLVDITRQALVNQAPIWYDLVMTAYKDKSLMLVHQYGLMFINLLQDLDRILGTNKNFMLGPWLESAKALATTEQEKENYEYNARNQITLWGPDGQILDYAGKQWSGLMADYYAPRWNLLFKYLETSLHNQVPFNQADYHADYLENLGKPFCVSKKLYPTIPQEDSVTVAQQIYNTWSKYVVLTK